MNQPPQGHNPYSPQPPGAPAQAGGPHAPQQPAGGYNPYAPPSEPAQLDAPTPGASTVGANMWVDGDKLVIPREGAVFPDRCVQCNAPTGYKLERKLFWHPPWVYIFILISIWIYIILALVLRKKAHVHVGLCDEHRAKRKNAMLIGWVGSLATIATCTGGLAMENDAGAVIALLSGIAFLVVLIVGLVRAQTVVPRKMDDTYAWLKVGAPFLQSFSAPQPGQQPPPQY